MPSLLQCLRHQRGGPSVMSLHSSKACCGRGEPDIYRRLCLEVDRVVLDVVLAHVKGNQVQASELLGISRTTLRTKLGALSRFAENRLTDETEPKDS